MIKDHRTKTPDRNDLKLGIVVVLDSVSKPVHFGFMAQNHHFRTFGTPFICVEWMQLQNSNFVRKCITGGYCLWIRNYAGMQRVSHTIIPCEKVTPTYTMRSNEMVFPWYFVQRSALSPEQLCLSSRSGFASPQNEHSS